MNFPATTYTADIKVPRTRVSHLVDVFDDVLLE